KMSEPGIIRDFRVVSMTFSPFTYNPSTRTLEVTDNITYRVSYNNAPGINEMDAPEMYSPSFMPLYRSLISNLDEVMDRNMPLHNKRLLIIYGASTDQQYLDKLDEFITWKKQKGYKVTSASTDATGTTTTAVKAYIQSKYNNIYTRPEYILLIGDATGALHIDCNSVGGGSSDYPYTQLAGTDTMGDVFIGRMPAETVTHFLTMANKVFTYERDTVPMPDAWYNHMLLVGDPTHSGISTQYVCRFMKWASLNINPNYTFTELTGNATAMTADINTGASFFVYRGYIGMSGWDGPPSESSFTNGNKMPHCIINTCATGSFDGTDVTDSIVRYGSPALPKGAITAIGMATAGTHTLMNNVLSSQTIDGIFNWGMRDMSAPLLTAKLMLYMIYNDFLPSYAVNFPGWCNLMGDPTVEVFIGTPQAINVDYPATVFPGQTCYPVQALTTDGNPLEGAVVTIVNDELHLVMETDANGNAVFELPGDLENNESFVVTISKHDHIPVYDTIQVLANNGILVSNAVYLDAMGGNNNGNPDAGETLSVNVTLTNPGTSAIIGAGVEMTSVDPYITILQANANYGDIPANGSATNDVAYQLSIAGNTPPDYMAAVKLEVAGQNYSTYLGIDIHNADINIDSYQLYDDNGILEPGETTWFSLSLVNNGTHGVSGITAELSCDSHLIYFNDDTAFYGNAMPGSVITNITDGLSISARDQLLTGTNVEVIVHLFNDNGFSEYEKFYIPTGVPNISHPTGPDAFGHYIYHSSDTNWPDAPVYNWIGIAPAEGGQGTQFTSISDSGTDGGDGDVNGADTIDNTNLPFTFTFYGRDYDEVYVCSNGFMTFIPTEIGTFRNFPIPGPMCPDPLVAPFWDDMYFQNGSGGGIFHWYDSANHLFVIEWYNAKNGFNASYTEQFQVILYDPEYYPTSTGDGMIKFQYHTFNDIDAGNTSSYPPLTGQYSTVGISDHTGTDGIQYLFDQDYGSTSQMITNGTALLITGAPYLDVSPILSINNISYVESNGDGFIEPGETVNLTISLYNSGLTAAEEVTALLNCTDSNVSVLNGMSSYTIIPNDGVGENEISFDIQVSPSAPTEYTVPFTLTLTDGENIWELNDSFYVRAPSIELNFLFYSDYETGNGDGLPNSPEQLYMIVDYANPGSVEIYDVQADLTSSTPGVVIDNGQQVINRIPAFSSIQVWYPVSIPSGLTQGNQLQFTAAYQTDLIPQETHNFSLSIGIHEDISPVEVINGTVSVDNGTPDLSNCIVKTNSIFNAAVAGDGSYKLFVEEDTFTHSTDMPHYGPSVLNNVVVDGANQVLTGIDFELEMLPEPTALVASYEAPMITVEWEDPVNSSFDVIGYNVYGRINDGEYSLLVYVDDEEYSEAIEDNNDYYYYIEAVYNEGVSIPSEELLFNVTGNTQDDVAPIVTELYGNYPNPFNPVTNISYSLAVAGNVKIDIYNIRGQHVRSLINETQTVGKHVIQWNGKDNNDGDCATGLYMYRFQTKGVDTIKKAMLLK
ncbi:MAG: T9SS type A sorting domain-containing protein, partial [Candidatus Cloacimonetes bacterium]|nr:T9SS type A sorting domain-containing protein [Candidatus Cloacimonadota bacterium]